MPNKSYSQLMKEAGEYLTLKIDLSEPIELIDLSEMFSSFGEQYDAYAMEEHGAGRGVARFYVKEIRKGCIEVDIITHAIDMMDKGLIVGGFAALFSKRIRKFVTGQFQGNETKKAGRWVADIVKSVAKDPNGSLALKKIDVAEGPDHAQVIVEFNTQEAQQALTNATRLVLGPETPEEENRFRQRVIMRFTRPDFFDADVNKSTGERVIIDEISERPLPLIYASELAEDKIKSVIRERRIFKLGFNVDVYEHRIGDKLKGYKLVEVHQIFELPDDDNDGQGSLIED
ncbi:MAG: hypothetical protein KDD85_01440 [Parvularculaceae bacterium]|nr:hypothetical protein [Parvularculaceae bacterium]